MDLIKERCCCFTGHRFLAVRDHLLIRMELRREITQRIEEGYTTFLIGGALGFDTLAAMEVLHAREQYDGIFLVLVLPCLGQEQRWAPKDRARYFELLQAADEVIYTGDEYTSGCMFVRNRYLVDHSSACICYLREGATRGGTAYTVRYAEKCGLKVFNLK